MNHKALICEICQEVFAQQPLLIRRLDSLGNLVFSVHFVADEKYVLKIFSNDSKDIFSPESSISQYVLNNSFLLKSLVYKETPTWRIERYLEGSTLTIDNHHCQLHRQMYMKRVNEFHKQSYRVGSEHHPLARLWADKDRMYDIILSNAKSDPCYPHIAKALEDYNYFYTDIFLNYNPKEKLVLLHNDLLYSNWLFDTTLRRFQLIDFEFASMGSS